VAIFPKWLEIFQPNFTCLLCVPISMLDYEFLFNYLQLLRSKLCHIKCDHPAYVSVDGGYFEHIMVVTLYGITSSKLQVIE